MILTLSPSSLETYQECETKGFFSNIKRLESLDLDRSKMDRGKLFHELLQIHYTMLKAGVAYNEIILHVISAARQKYIDGEYPNDMVNECIKNYQEYAVFYQGDGWIPLEIEAPFTKVLYESSDHTIVLEGRIDLMVQSGQIKSPVDHKTSDKKEYSPSILSNQFFCYVLVTDSFTMVKNEIGFQKTLGPSERFNRHVLSYTDDILKEWKENTIDTAFEIIGHLGSGNFPKRFSSCFRCHFKKICESDPSNRDFKIENNYKVRPEFDIYGVEK